MLIKICGITDPETARFAVKQGAHFIGLLFSDISPRKIDLKTALAIVRAVREEGGEPVGVFADETLDEILAISSALELSVVQLHGEIPKEACPHLPMAKIYFVGDGPIPAHLDRARDYLLFEKETRDPQGFRFFVAGGLNAENVGAAIEKYRPFGVDVSRGVEERLAVKSREKIEAFIANARPGRFGPFGGMYVPSFWSSLFRSYLTPSHGLLNRRRFKSGFPIFSTPMPDARRP